MQDESTGGSTAETKLTAADFPKNSEFVSQELTKSDRPELGSARIVVSGGRGMKSGENFELLYKVSSPLFLPTKSSLRVSFEQIPTSVKPNRFTRLVQSSVVSLISQVI